MSHFQFGVIPLSCLSSCLSLVVLAQQSWFLVFPVIVYQGFVVQFCWIFSLILIDCFCLVTFRFLYTLQGLVLKFSLYFKCLLKMGISTGAPLYVLIDFGRWVFRVGTFCLLILSDFLCSACSGYSALFGQGLAPGICSNTWSDWFWCSYWTGFVKHAETLIAFEQLPYWKYFLIPYNNFDFGPRWLSASNSGLLSRWLAVHLRCSNFGRETRKLACLSACFASFQSAYSGQRYPHAQSCFHRPARLLCSSAKRCFWIRSGLWLHLSSHWCLRSSVGLSSASSSCLNHKHYFDCELCFPV